MLWNTKLFRISFGLSICMFCSTWWKLDFCQFCCITAAVNSTTNCRIQHSVYHKWVGSKPTEWVLYLLCYVHWLLIWLRIVSEMNQMQYMIFLCIQQRIAFVKSNRFKGYRIQEKKTVSLFKFIYPIITVLCLKWQCCKKSTLITSTK